MYYACTLFVSCSQGKVFTVYNVIICGGRGVDVFYFCNMYTCAVKLPGYNPFHFSANFGLSAIV